MNDVRGTPVSCSASAQLDGYETALRSYQNYVGYPIAAIDAVLAGHEGFVLGHVFRAAVLMTAGERRVVAQADRSLKTAQALIGSANDREKPVCVRPHAIAVAVPMIRRMAIVQPMTARANDGSNSWIAKRSIPPASWYNT